MLWNYDVSDKEEAERMASLYGEDFTRAVEPGMEVETGRNLVRRCGNELGVATWEAYDFDPDTWTCETFSNREAAELWLSGSLYCLVESIDELIEYGYVDESGVYENPIAAIGTMLAEAALEHARADAEYFDEDFRMRATEGINLWTVAKEIIEAVPAAKPAEEEPAQARGPKH